MCDAPANVPTRTAAAAKRAANQLVAAGESSLSVSAAKIETRAPGRREDVARKDGRLQRYE